MHVLIRRPYLEDIINSSGKFRAYNRKRTVIIMKLDFSVWSNYLWGLEPERRIDTFLAHGFNRSEFSDEDGALILERGGNAAKQLRSYADSVGFR